MCERMYTYFNVSVFTVELAEDLATEETEQVHTLQIYTI